jgi:hypothetical protein
MSSTKSLHGSCAHCGKPLVFSAEHAGQTVPCPHCGQATELWLAQPVKESVVPRKAILLTIGTIGILLLLLFGCLLGLAHFQRLAKERKQNPGSGNPATNAAPWPKR